MSRRSFFVPLVPALLCGWSGPAWAQHEEEVAPLLDEYWTREVVAVQPLRHPKQGAVELVGVVGVIPNDAFVIYVPLGVRLGYHLTESLALEISFAYHVQADTDLARFLEENDAQLRARVRDRQQLRTSLSLAWAPLYGKLAAGSGILHFDAYLLGGGGIVRTEEEEALDLDAATCPDFLLGAGVRARFGGRWLVRIEVRQHLFLRPEDRSGGGGGVGLPTEISVGGGLLIGGR